MKAGGVNAKARVTSWRFRTTMAAQSRLVRLRKSKAFLGRCVICFFLSYGFVVSEKMPPSVDGVIGANVKLDVVM